MPHKNKHTRQRLESVDPFRSQEPYLKRRVVESLTSHHYDHVTRERMKYDFRYGNDYEVQRLRFKRGDQEEPAEPPPPPPEAEPAEPPPTEEAAPIESPVTEADAAPAPAPAPGPAPAPSPPSQPTTHVQYLAPLYGITAVFGALFILGPLFVRKGPNKEIVRACIMMTAFCCWIFWVTIYFGQMNAIMGPRLDNTTVAWMAYKWGQVSVSTPAPPPPPTQASTTAAPSEETTETPSTPSTPSPDVLTTPSPDMPAEPEERLLRKRQKGFTQLGTETQNALTPTA